MASRRQEDLRRRPVRQDRTDVPAIHKEPEVSEILEDEDDDPLVLKGSIPTGPPKKLSEGTEEEWGIEDDGNWGGGKTDQSEPKRETQEQRIQRVVQPSNTEVGVAFLLHLALLGFYVYVHVYDGTNMKKTKGRGVAGHNTFGGRWKFLTYIDLWVQLGFFFLAFLRDIMPGSYARQMLGKFCDFIFNSLVFPLALFVAIAFWALYAIDQELVYPAAVAKYNPALLNHFWHTTIVIGVFLEVLLVFHCYPTTANAVSMIFCFCTGYIVWIVIILTVSNFWVYPFLQTMPPPLISVFFAACFFVCLGLYFLGKMIGHRRWQERHLLIEELKL